MSVKVIGTVTHSGEKNFPVFVDSDGLVSFCIVADNTARDAIATYRRKQGLHCYVISGNNTYTLGADLTTWTLKDSSSYILSSEKGAANGVAPLNANGKIDGSYLQSLFINAAIGVADIAEMLATSSVAGNLFVVEDASGDPPNTGSAVYYKNNNDDPSDITDFLQLDFGASVVSVNGETGIVTISIASLLAVPANVTAFDNQVAASAYATANDGVISTIQGNVSGLQSDVNDLDTNKVDKVSGKALSENDYTDADKAKVDILTTGGDGNSYLANDGEYKAIPEAGIEEAPQNGEPHARQDGEWIEIPAQTTATLGAVIAGAADATPNDTDVVATVESSVVKKITWTNVKVFLKTYFDTVYQLASGKDATGGYVGLTLFKINFKNTANTFTSFFTNANTAARTYTFQDRDGTIVDDTDLGLKQNTITFGTGVQTALGVNIGSAGAPILFDGAGGTPLSITLTNATGLPISTGVSGLGTGVATWLGTPSWTNFGSAITGTAPYWGLSGTSTITADVTIAGNFNKYFTGTKSFVIGHTAVTTATTRLQVRGIGTTTGALALFEDSAGTAKLTLLDDGTTSIDGFLRIGSTGTPTIQMRYTASGGGYDTVLSYNGSSRSLSTLGGVISTTNTGSTILSNVVQASSINLLTLTGVAHSGGLHTLLTVTGGTYTGITASTENSDVNINLARTITWATGALTTQRFVRIQTPTIAFAGASTVTDAYTFHIGGAPIAGTNATLTRTWAAGFAGNVEITGALTVGTTCALVGTITNNNATAGHIGEEVNSTVSTYTNYSTTATYQNVTSITLSAGDWDLSAFFTYSSNGATITAASNGVFVISTTTASASGATEGLNMAYVPQAALLGTSKFSDSITPYRVSLSGTTTYYLNTQADFTLGNPQFAGSIRARRMR